MFVNTHFLAPCYAVERPFRDCCLEAWQQWAQSANASTMEQRGEALRRVIHCQQEKGQTLDLSQLHLTDLPDQWPLSITQLNIEGNKLCQLPAQLPPYLERLIAFGNQLISLPAQLPTSLQQLNVSNNKLHQLPAQLPPDLRQLEAAWNDLIALPSDLPHSLQWLSVNGNRLSQLPAQLPVNLEKLYVGFNQLQQLPSPLPLGLVELSVYDNQLTQLPEPLPPSLCYLDASRNQLTGLPVQFPLTLEILNVSHNQLTLFMMPLPAALKALDISYNRLTLFMMTSSMPFLKEIDVSHNQLSFFPQEIRQSVLLCYTDANPINAVHPAHTIFMDSIAEWTNETSGWLTVQHRTDAQRFGYFLRTLKIGSQPPNALLKKQVIRLLDYLTKEAHQPLRERFFKMVEKMSISGATVGLYYFTQMYVIMMEHQLMSHSHYVGHLFYNNRVFFRLHLLRQLAVESVKTDTGSTRFIEEVNLFLLYQSKLRNRLSLPIYGEVKLDALPTVTDERLEQVLQAVHRREKSGFIRYLVTQSISWRARLLSWNYMQMNAMYNAYLEATSRAGSDCRPAQRWFYINCYQLSWRFLLAHKAVELVDQFDRPKHKMTLIDQHYYYHNMNSH